MSQCRNGCQAAILNGALYIAGGHNGTEYLNSMEVYRDGGDDWEMLAPMRCCRGFGGCAVMAGMLYVMGGTSELNHYRIQILARILESGLTLILD